MDIQFNYDAIRKDFVIFHIHKDSGNYYKSTLLDAIHQLGHCYSVVYQQGSSCYTLFPTDRPNDFLSVLKQNAETIDSAVTVQRIDPEKLPWYMLAQLLCNALPILLNDYADYSNTQGKLYYRIPDTKKKIKMNVRPSFSMLQIQFNWDCEITLKMQPFCAVKKDQSPANQAQYLFDPDSGELRREFPSDNASIPRYLNRAANSHKKTTAPFLCFDTLEAYRDSKVGILHRFLKDVADILSPYMTLTPRPITEGAHYIPDTHQLPHTLEDTRKRLASVPFYLEDTIQDDASTALLYLIQQELMQYSQVHALTDKPSPGSVVLRIIHNRDWYAMRNLPDPHETIRPGYIVQHVTLEDFKITGYSRRSQKDTEDVALKKVLLEIAIKLDIQARKICIYPWQQLGLSEPFHIVQAISRKDKGPFFCYRLTIQPDGQMQFDYWSSDDPNKDITQCEMTNAFLNRNGKLDSQMDGLVRLGNSPICKIQQTERYTLPHIDHLENALRSTRDGSLLEVFPVRELAQELAAAAPQKQQHSYQKIMNSLDTLGTTATRKDIRSAISLKSSAGQNINRTYSERTGILIGNDIRQKKNFEKYFGATLDIRWYAEKEKVFYFSGNKSQSLENAFPHACRVRKLTACDSSDCTALMQTLLPMLAVDFVTASGWTVLPFPFKYLREFTAQANPKQIIPCPE